MNKRKLTIKQKKFIDAMADPRTKSQTEAAVKAGCPPKSARITASRWLTNANISAAIEKRKQRALAHSDIKPEEVLGRAAQNMRVSIDDVLNENGAFDLEKARTTGAIDDVKKYKFITLINAETGDRISKTEIEMYSSADARKEVARYIGLEKNPIPQKTSLSEKEMAIELFRRLVENRGFTPDKALQAAKVEFPKADLTAFEAELVGRTGQKQPEDSK